MLVQIIYVHLLLEEIFEEIYFKSFKLFGYEVMQSMQFLVKLIRGQITNYAKWEQYN